MHRNQIVSREDWLVARQAHLVREKEFTRQRDELSDQRRQLPWVVVDKDYAFYGPDGTESLSDLFEGRSQLIVYHFMFGPDWDEGCPSCSLICDHFDGAAVHLNQRDVTLIVVSRAPYEKLDKFKSRMGWKFKWLSSHGGDFNYDYQVSFADDDNGDDEIYYNYKMGKFPSSEAPGLSAFIKDDKGEVFHTYSSYGRGVETLIGAYSILDLAPKGRDEADLPFPMAWVRRHDQYNE